MDDDTTLPRRSRRTVLRGGTAVAVFGGLFLLSCGGDDDDTPAPGSRLATAFAGSPTPPLRPTTGSGGGAPSTGTLYERLGSRPAIDRAVSEFLPLVALDNRINAFFANADPTRFGTLLGDLIGSLTGGPEKYGGKDMKTAHAGMKIQKQHFDALMEDLTTALSRLNIPKKETDELVAILGPMNTDIVTA